MQTKRRRNTQDHIRSHETRLRKPSSHVAGAGAGAAAAGVAYLPVIGDPADVHGLHPTGLVRLHHLRQAVLGHLHHKADLFREGA